MVTSRAVRVVWPGFVTEEGLRREAAISELVRQPDATSGAVARKRKRGRAKFLHRFKIHPRKRAAESQESLNRDYSAFLRRRGWAIFDGCVRCDSAGSSLRTGFRSAGHRALALEV